jgi:hypothetical protein
VTLCPPKDDVAIAQKPPNNESNENNDHKRLEWIDTFLERVFADLPWGVIAFGAIAIGGLYWTLHDPTGLKHGDYLTAVGSGSGLLAIGHGIRSRRGP